MPTKACPLFAWWGLSLDGIPKSQHMLQSCSAYGRCGVTCCHDASVTAASQTGPITISSLHTAHGQTRTGCLGPPHAVTLDSSMHRAWTAALHSRCQCARRRSCLPYCSPLAHPCCPALQHSILIATAQQPLSLMTPPARPHPRPPARPPAASPIPPVNMCLHDLPPWPPPKPPSPGAVPPGSCRRARLELRQRRASSACVVATDKLRRCSSTAVPWSMAFSCLSVGSLPS